ncbi:thioredoxin family protein [Neolewinella antarctica]|uniref:Thioredoxin-like negative regulator of GroEL n=1 Tax=Neolewinella antarctica TaxID=442734 RepID=A0ABX0X886_9BACT|nr:thioredoxin family protein [Neolewinella antarctica]NJC25455.1 thioredoxin-like negative regulator of GroEL [Neolewinella antarctica]
MTKERNPIEQNEDYLSDWLENSDRRVVILAFTAAWVGSFFLFRGYLEDLKEKHGENVGLQIIDVEKYGSIARKLGVSQVPTTILLRNHEIVDMLIGTTSRNKLLASVKPYL